MNENLIWGRIVFQIERVVWLALVLKKSIDVAKTYSATAEDCLRARLVKRLKMNLELVFQYTFHR